MYESWLQISNRTTISDVCEVFGETDKLWAHNRLSKKLLLKSKHVSNISDFVGVKGQHLECG